MTDKGNRCRNKNDGTSHRIGDQATHEHTFPNSRDDNLKYEYKTLRNTWIASTIDTSTNDTTRDVRRSVPPAKRFRTAISWPGGISTRGAKQDSLFGDVGTSGSRFQESAGRYLDSSQTTTRAAFPGLVASMWSARGWPRIAKQTTRQCTQVWAGAVYRSVCDMPLLRTACAVSPCTHSTVRACDSDTSKSLDSNALRSLPPLRPSLPRVEQF